MSIVKTLSDRTCSFTFVHWLSFFLYMKLWTMFLIVHGSVVAIHWYTGASTANFG